jgi:hypothetical protein
LFSIFLVLLRFVHHLADLHLPPSWTPRPASSHSGGAAVRTESQDLERMISEAAMRETVASNEHATVESPTSGMAMTVVAGPSKDVARASTA